MSVKVGVEMEGQLPQLMSLNQGEPLAAFIKELCTRWHLEKAEEYALQFQDKSKPFYVNERNRVDIEAGNVLKLTFTPSKIASDVIAGLDGSKVDTIGDTLQLLAQQSVYSTFAQEFINKDGLQKLMTMIEGGSFAGGDVMGYALKAFVELMDHQIVSWERLEVKFIKQVSSAVNITRNTTSDATTLQLALEILESIVLHSGKYGMVEQEVTPMTLIEHLQKTRNAETHKRALALINALFLKADHVKQKRIAENLLSKSLRNVILTNVIKRQGALPEGNALHDADMSHQLYVLQTLLFNLLEERKHTKVDASDQNVLRDINEMRKIAFEMDSDSGSGSRKQAHTKEYKKLGFKNHVNPVDDFTQVPPGVLALDNMVYFAKIHSEEYTKVVLENCSRADDHDLPFARSSIELTNMLCNVLKVGQPPADGGLTYYPMFFTHDKPFEEFFCIAIQLLNKTWKEMRATSADFHKVMEVTQEQIVRTLTDHPNTHQLVIFKDRLTRLSYSEITKIWQRERKHKEETESQATPIMELREQVKPEIVELIKQQRLNYLVEGTMFHSKSKNKDRTWFCRLSPNHKVLHHGDCEESDRPPVEKLPNKLPIVDIKSLVTGKDCQHIKERRHKSFVNTAFSILTESEMGEHLNFIAPDNMTYNYWTDGINALLGNPMASEQAEQDLVMLLNMEIRLRLLDTEGITIPSTPPPIPSPPPNYDFHYSNA